MERITVPSDYPEKYTLGIGGVTLDIRPYFFIALSVRQNGYDYIKRKYNENKWTYFEAYKNSEYRTNPALTCYPIDVEEIIRMLIGIYEESERTGNFDVLLGIVKNQYKSLYRFVETKKSFDEEEFTNYTKKRSKADFPDTRMYMYSLYVAVFLCHHFSKNFAISLTATSSMIGIAETPNTPEQRDAHWENNDEKVKEKVKAMEEMYYLPLPKNQFQLWEYIGSQMQEVDRAQSKGQYVDPLKIVNIQERLNSFVAFGDIIESFGIDPIEIQNLRLQPSEMRRILQEYTIHQIEHDETPIDFNLFFSFYYYLKRLADMYQDAKVRLLDTTEEEKFIFAKKKEREIEKREEKLIRVEKEAERVSKNQKEKNQQLQEELNLLKKKEKEWEKDKREQQKEKKELSALRSFVYRLEQEENEESKEANDTNEARLAELKRKRIVFFGGHPNWIQKTKELFPEARFLEVDDINRNLSFIQNYDVVCINTDHFNHGFYEKLMNEVSRQKVKLVYIQGATNEERVIDMLYKGIQE